MICPYCLGEGQLKILLGDKLVYQFDEEAVFEPFPCEECDGTGEVNDD